MHQHTCHTAGKALLSGFLPVRLTHPATQLALGPSSRDRDRVSLLLSHNHCLALNTGYVFWVRTRQPTAKQRINQSAMQKKKTSLDDLTFKSTGPHQFSYLGSLLTIPSLSRPARMLAVSSELPVTTWTLAGLHSSAAPFTKSATAGGSEGIEARDRTPTLAPTPPCLKEEKVRKMFQRKKATQLNTI